MPSLKSALLGLAATITTLARADWDFGGYGQSGSFVNISAARDSWTKVYNASNATGLLTFTGYDVSLPWPGKPLDGWTITARGVDMTNLDDELIAEGKRRVVGDDVRIVAPEALLKAHNGSTRGNSTTNGNSPADGGSPIVNVHDDWIFCAWPWYLPLSGNDSYANNPKNISSESDGSCLPWLSASCIAGLETAAKRAYEIVERTGPWGQRHRCKQISVPSACSNSYMRQSSVIADHWGVPLDYLNGSTTFQDGYSLDGRDGPSEYKERWLTITHSYRPILTLFGKSNSDSDAEVESGFAKLVCIRAQEQGEVPIEKEKGKNGTAGLVMTWSLILASASVAIVWSL